MGCGSSAPAPAPTIKFLHGEPTFKGDLVVQSLDTGNGMLYRIVDKKTKQWAFYNDTTNCQIMVEYNFSVHNRVKALGNTQVEKVGNGGQVMTLVVLPLATEMFIEGDAMRYTSKFIPLPVDQPQTEVAAE